MITDKMTRESEIQRRLREVEAQEAALRQRLAALESVKPEEPVLQKSFEVAAALPSTTGGKKLIDMTRIALPVPKGYYTQHMVSFNTIITPDAKGRGVIDFADRDVFDGKHYIQWSANDSYIQAIKKIRGDVVGDITGAGDVTPAEAERIATLRRLHKQDSWTLSDRATWEKNISWIISDRVANVKSLGKYRLSSSLSQTFNDVSADIDKDTREHLFDCKAMAAMEGSILQMAENALLPARKDGTESYKWAAPYFCVPGTVCDSAGKQPTGHVFILSPVTMNVIESTETRSRVSSYARNLVKDYTLENFVAGYPFITKVDNERTVQTLTYSTYVGGMPDEDIFKAAHDKAMQTIQKQLAPQPSAPSPVLGP